MFLDGEKKSILTRDLRETIKGKFSYELVKSIQKQILTVNPSKALLKIAEQLQAVIQIFFCIHWIANALGYHDGLRNIHI